MNQKEVQEYLNKLKKEKNIRIYTPYKYFQGLKTKKDVCSRFLEMVRNSYKPFQTDKKVVTKPSQYTTEFKKRYGDNITSITQKSKVTGVPVSILKIIFKKGQAAWRTGQLHKINGDMQE